MVAAARAGTWTPLINTAPSSSGGVMLLLTDGTVMCKSSSGGGDGIGNVWNKLTPDSAGSYVNGTWTTLAPMTSTRLYFSSQVLKDGRVFVAGGEYGTGGSLGETYDPVLDTWTAAPAQGQRISDANSELLPDGRVLVALVTGALRSTIIFDPVTNIWTAGPTANGIHNESAWVKLADGSSLMVDRLSTNSERYIPSLNQWVVDATVPVALYDAFGDETGPGFLLPDGRAFFIGSPSNTAYYTPSSTNSPGTWAAGPTIPNAQGAPDAPGAMMPNGKILCAVSPTPTSANHFPSPTTFYEFDYTAGTNGIFTAINAPNGGTTLNAPTYVTNMLLLPDGSVLYNSLGATQYYVYASGGTPLASGKPTISAITQNGDGSFHLTGTKLNGISQGAAYGDDWQMSTNYPIVRLTFGGNVYFARTYNWSSVGVQTGSIPVTTEFTLPAGLPAGTYSMAVIANGISSDPVPFYPFGHFAISVAASASEGDAPVIATVSVSWARSSDLVVSLGSSDSASATVPATVTILAGQTSATFPVTIIDDELLNGSRGVTLTATGNGYASGAATLVVDDNETATLSVTAPVSVGEGAGTAQGTITVSAPPDSAVAVNLTSGDTAAISVPATVTIPAGQTSANFTITVIDDTKINGTHPATITAHVANWTDGATVINVLDNENTNLVLSLPVSVSEGGTGTGTVSISGTLTAALTVSLASGDTAHLTVPATVSIPAGATSGNFTLTAPENPLTEGTKDVTITASTSGFTSANATTGVLDNDVHHYAISAIASPQVGSVAFGVTITAKDVNGVTIASYTGAPGLSASGSGGAESITPTATTAFSSGVWTGNVAVNAIDSNVTLTVSDGAGHTGVSNPFNVGSGPLHHFAWSAIASPLIANAAFSTTVIAKDSVNNTVTGFSGTVNLGGYTSSPSASSVLITELNPNGTDGIEFMNVRAVGASPVNLSNWTVHIYDNSTGWPAPKFTFTIPAGTMCASGAVFTLLKIGTGTVPGVYPSFFCANTNAFSWTTGTSMRAAVMLRDAAGNIVDFVAVGSATPASITSPVAVPASKWSGATVVASSSTTKSYQRIGSSDGNSASDWTFATTGMGTANSNLIAPFPPVSTPVTVTPTISASFVNGVWTGNMAVPAAAAQMKLRADDGSGHAGDSNAFDVVMVPPAASTAAGTAITGTGATLNGTVNANSNSTVVSFDYGTSASYGTNVASTPSAVTGSGNTAVSATITGLRAVTTYHFRVRAVNVNGSASGNDMTFTTPPWTPQDWRLKWYGTPVSSGDAADAADPYHTGIPNLAVFSFLGPDQNPAQAAAVQLPQPQIVGQNFVLSFTQPAGVSGVTYGAEWRAALDTGTWQTVTDSGTGTFHTFSVPVGGNEKLFMRLTVSDP